MAVDIFLCGQIQIYREKQYRGRGVEGRTEVFNKQYTKE